MAGVIAALSQQTLRLRKAALRLSEIREDHIKRENTSIYDYKCRELSTLIVIDILYHA